MKIGQRVYYIKRYSTECGRRVCALCGEDLGPKLSFSFWRLGASPLVELFNVDDVECCFIEASTVGHKMCNVFETREEADARLKYLEEKNAEYALRESCACFICTSHTLCVVRR